MNEARLHERAIVETEHIGPGTRVWAHAHILAGARVGAECNVCDGVFIEGDVIVGDRVTIKCGVQLWNGLRVEDDVFIGPNATFTNDRMPRSRAWLPEHPTTVIRAGASIGANATILPGVEIGRGAMVGAGAVVTRSVPSHAVVVGNPARIHGYLGTEATSPSGTPRVPAQPGVRPLGVGGVVVHRLPEFSDLRGRLTAGEVPDVPPFPVRRFFLVFGVPSREVRGAHAHRECHQFLVCVAGSLSASVDDGTSRSEVVLDSPTLGLYVPPMVWGSQYLYSENAVLLVFASHGYEAADYIRDYGEFLATLSRAA